MVSHVSPGYYSRAADTRVSDAHTILLSSSNQIDKPLHAVNSLALLVVLCYAATGYCLLPSDIVQFIRPSADRIAKDALMMLIPRHERWPVLTSTQGYLIRNMRFINSRIRRYEMSQETEAQ